MTFKEWLLTESKTQYQIGLYPDLYDIVGQYPPLYATPHAADFIYYYTNYIKNNPPKDKDGFV